MITKFAGVINGAGPSAAPALGAPYTHHQWQRRCRVSVLNSSPCDEFVTSSTSFTRRDWPTFSQLFSQIRRSFGAWTSGDREEEPPVCLFGPFYRRSVTSAPVRWDDLRLFWHEKVHYMVPLPHLQAWGVKKRPFSRSLGSESASAGE